MRKDKIIRIRYATYLRIRRYFKPLRNESAADYFDRMSRSIEEKAVWEYD